MTLEQGPYIQMAGFCEQAIEDKTGVLSLIRIIDTLTHRAVGPAEMPPVPFHMKLVIMLKSGKARGRHELKIVPELPSGEAKSPLLLTVYMEGEERGQNIITDFYFTFPLEGLYWFNISFDDSLLTKIPFRVKYERLITAASAT